MTDITEGLDLLGDWLDAKGYTEEAGLCTRAMDEINRLRAELADMRERCKLNYELGVQRGKMDAEALRAENARLREALKPFADVAEHDICESLTDADIFRPMTREYSRASMLTVGDLRNCKRILDGSTIE